MISVSLKYDRPGCSILLNTHSRVTVSLPVGQPLYNWYGVTVNPWCSWVVLPSVIIDRPAHSMTGKWYGMLKCIAQMNIAAYTPRKLINEHLWGTACCIHGNLATRSLLSVANGIIMTPANYHTDCPDSCPHNELYGPVQRALTTSTILVRSSNYHEVYSLDPHDR
jgi:hypothetical protein